MKILLVLGSVVVVSLLVFFMKVGASENVAPLSNLSDREWVMIQTLPELFLQMGPVETARVKRVIDGDTVELENGEKVRYLGMDTPETEHPDKPIECFGKEASEVNRVLVEGEMVKLKSSGNDRDGYGRLLRYVWVPYEIDGTKRDVFVNGHLVWEGLARVPAYTKGQDLYESLALMETIAQEREIGLWRECE